MKTGQDEYGTPYPLQFRSFNDYKAPIPVYLLVPFIAIGGMTPFAIRFPVAIASVLTVVATYFLSRRFFSVKTSLIVMFLLAVSPWHTHLSRGYFEATISLLFFVVGNAIIIRSNLSIKKLLLGMFFFALSLYSYFTPRIVLPFWICILFLFSFKHAKGSLQVTFKKAFYITFPKFLIGGLFLIVLALPLIYLTFFDKGFSRFGKLMQSAQTQVTLAVNQERYGSGLPDKWKKILHNKATVFTRFVATNYLQHLSLDFWYITGDSSLRYFLGNSGMFNLLEMPFLFIGIYALIRKKHSVLFIAISWMLIAAIPASIVGRPFGVRSLAMLPAPFLIVGYGIVVTVNYLKMSPLRYLYRGLLVVGFMGTLMYWSLRYFTEYPYYAATWWGWENKAAIDLGTKYENDYDYIFISDFYTASTLAYAVYKSVDPITYRYVVSHPVTLADDRHLIKIGKFYFGSLDIDSTRLKQQIIPPRSLYIGRPEEADGVDTINAPDDGRVLFKIHRT
ncbi:MAG: glycosyltransferase family 39 protein [Bacteroidota bacterium]